MVSAFEKDGVTVIEFLRLRGSPVYLHHLLYLLHVTDKDSLWSIRDGDDESDRESSLKMLDMCQSPQDDVAEQACTAIIHDLQTIKHLKADEIETLVTHLTSRTNSPCLCTTGILLARKFPPKKPLDVKLPQDVEWGRARRLLANL